jgi:hypothetical protein
MRLYLTDDHFDPDHVPPSGQRNGTVEFFADIAKLTKLTMEALDGTWSYKDAFDLSIGSAHQIGLKEGVPTSAIARAFASGQRR